MKTTVEKSTPNRSFLSKLLYCSIAAVLLLSVCFWAHPLRVYFAAKRAEQTNPYESALLYESLGTFADAQEMADRACTRLFKRAIDIGQNNNALLFYSRLQTDSAVSSASNELYAYAETCAASGQDAAAVCIFAALGSYRDSAAQSMAARYRIADKTEQAGDLPAAYGAFLRLGDYADSAGRAALCQENYYRQLVDQYEEDRLSSREFCRLIVRRYADAENYYKIYLLQTSKWLPEDYERNMSLIAELGDFEGMAAHGFFAARTLGVRYADGSLYFELDETGRLQTNLPHYTLPGYAGLYWGIDRDGVYRIGSDEKQAWTPMFRLTLENSDNTLVVYCYTDGGTYTLHRIPG